MTTFTQGVAATNCIYAGGDRVAECRDAIIAVALLRIINAHDDLVAALKLLIDASTPDISERAPVMLQARAALAKAMGGGE